MSEQLMQFGNKRDLYEFMPGALSVQSTPPNPLARWLALSLLLLVGLAIAWACIGRVNIVVSANGKILPSQRAQVIQPFEKGTIAEIFVENGDVVEKGQALVLLNTDFSQADLNSIEISIYSLRRRIAINEVIKERLAAIDQADSIQFTEADWYQNTRDFEFDRTALKETWGQTIASYRQLQEKLARIQSEQAINSSTIQKLQLTLPIVTKRMQKITELYQQNAATELEYLAMQKQSIESEFQLKTEQERKSLLLAIEAESNQQTAALLSQSAARIHSELTSLYQQLESLQQEKNKAQSRLAKHTLVSPVAGTVQELSITTLGGVVTDAEPLMNIIPIGDAVDVEVFIENKDIGYVQPGMQAEVKIHTLPFTKYGIVDAEILSISNDAIVDDRLGLVFSMMLRMQKSSLIAEGKTVAFKPGMAVTAEVQTGERRLIEFFLSPLMRVSQESLRER